MGLLSRRAFPEPDEGGLGGPVAAGMSPGAAARVLGSLERDGIRDAGAVSAALALRRVLLHAAAQSGDLPAFEAQVRAMGGLLRQARAEGLMPGSARRAASLAVRDAVAAGVALLCVRGTPPRFRIVRASFAHAVEPQHIALVARAAVAQCVAAGSRRHARALARVLRKRLERSFAQGSGVLVPPDLAVECSCALLERMGADDRMLACTAALAAAHALGNSAAAAVEAAEAVICTPSGTLASADARALAHAVASVAWHSLGDTAEAARHAKACRAVPIARVARRWGNVPAACELIERVRALGAG